MTNHGSYPSEAVISAREEEQRKTKPTKKKGIAALNHSKIVRTAPPSTQLWPGAMGGNQMPNHHPEQDFLVVAEPFFQRITSNWTSKGFHPGTRLIVTWALCIHHEANYVERLGLHQQLQRMHDLMCQTPRNFGRTDTESCRLFTINSRSTH